MTLALRLGRTVSELAGSMSSSELMMWVAFDRISPIGDIRGDIQTANIVSSLYGAQGGKVTLRDALLKWGHQEDAPAKDGLEGFLGAISEN